MKSARLTKSLTAYLLFLVSMDSERRPSVLPKVFCYLVRNPFGSNKNQDLCVFCADLVEMLYQFRSLLKVAANFHNLTDVVVRSEFHRANVNLDHVSKEILHGRQYERKESCLE